MKTIISKLWNGNLAPGENCADRTELFALVQKSAEDLSAGLTQEQKKSMEQYANLWEDYLLGMMEEAFREGFSLGCQMMVEALSGR